MRVSVIVPTYGNRLKYLKQTLETVQNQDYPADHYEIITVDNSPDGKAMPIVNKINQDGKQLVRYVREPKMGLLFARHAGARNAKNEILVYIDDDIIASSEWLTALVKPFDDPDVACSGGKVVPQWEADVPLWLSQFELGYLSILDLGDETKEIKHPNLWGCNMAVRKNILFALGGFHPDGIRGREFIWLRGDGECGLEKKIHDIGLKLIYEPRAWLYHRIPGSRLKPEYFYRRFFMQGVDDSYTYIRNMRVTNVKYLYLRVVKEVFLNFYRIIKAFIKSVVKKEQKIRFKADGLYWYARGRHHIKTIFNKDIRQHVFQDNYL